MPQVLLWMKFTTPMRGFLAMALPWKFMIWNQTIMLRKIGMRQQFNMETVIMELQEPIGRVQLVLMKKSEYQKLFYFILHTQILLIR